MIRGQLTYSLSRKTLEAHIHIPALLPGINFYAPYKHPMYSFIVALGVIPDLSCTKDLGYRPAANGYDEFLPELAITDQP